MNGKKELSKKRYEVFSQGMAEDFHSLEYNQ